MIEVLHRTGRIFSLRWDRNGCGHRTPACRAEKLYGGLMPSEMKRLKQLEEENS